MKALLMVSFGTSYPETRRKTLDLIQAEMTEAFPERTVFRAWTSRMIIRKVRERDGIQIDTVEEALQRMALAGADDVLIQSTHVIPGYEYEKMLQDVRKAEDSFRRISIGRPLLDTAEDMDAVVKVMAEAVPAEGDDVVICMGHGTAHEANDIYAEMQKAFRRAGHDAYYVATVEGSPVLSDVLGALEGRKAGMVHLVPLMVVSGDHVLNDMAGGEPHSWKRQCQEAGYEVICHLEGLGERQAIRDLLLQHAIAACNRSR